MDCRARSERGLARSFRVLCVLVAGAAPVACQFDRLLSDERVVPEEETRLTLAATGGNAQADTVGARLAQPYRVRVTNGDGEAVEGARVRWMVTAGSGSVSPATSLTDGDGLASTVHTLGPEAEVQSVSATVEGLTGAPIVFTATARPGRIAEIVFITQPRDTERNEDFDPPITVELRDRFGNRTTNADARVRIRIAPGTGSSRARLSGDTDRDAEDGTVAFPRLRINRAGEGYRLRVTVGDISADSAPFDIEDD